MTDLTLLPDDNTPVIVSLAGPDHLLRINRSDGTALVTLDRACKLSYGEGYEPDAAAVRFWEAMANVDFVRAALATIPELRTET